MVGVHREAARAGVEAGGAVLGLLRGRGREGREAALDVGQHLEGVGSRGSRSTAS